MQIHSRDALAEAYEMFVKSDRLQKAFEEMQNELEDDEDIEVPKNLGAQVKKLLKEQPDITWYRAIELVIDPDAPVKEQNKDEDEDDEDEDLEDTEE